MKTGIAMLSLALASGASLAAVTEVRVTVESLAPARGVAFSPFTVAFHDGSFNAFTPGTAASAGIQDIAELGDGTAYHSAFSASHPSGVTGTITATSGGFGPGVFIPGASGSFDFSLDSADNAFFNFGAMVVPSNDRFVGNDAGLQILDASGNLIVNSLTIGAGQIWDSGTEVDGPFGAAFLVGQDAMQHIDENGVITLNSDFSAYAGLATPAGYNLADLPAGDLLRISFEVVPAPSAAALLGLGGLVATRRRRN